jgi:hypothetical protein
VVELAARALAPVVVAPQVAELAQVLAVEQQLAELVLQQAELAQRPVELRQPVVPQRQLVLVRQQLLVQLQLQQPLRLVWWLPVWRLRRLWLLRWPRKPILFTKTPPRLPEQEPTRASSLLVALALPIAEINRLSKNAPTGAFFCAVE